MDGVRFGFELAEPWCGAVWEGLGVEVQYHVMKIPAYEEARGFAVAFYEWLSPGVKLETGTVLEMLLLSSEGIGDRSAESEDETIRW